MSEGVIPGVAKNIDAGTVVTLKDQVACLPGGSSARLLRKAMPSALPFTVLARRQKEIASHRAGGTVVSFLGTRKHYHR